MSTSTMNALMNFSQEFDPVVPTTYEQQLACEKERQSVYLKLSKYNLPTNLSTWELYRISRTGISPIDIHMRIILPDELQQLVYRSFFKTKVMFELKKCHQTVWYEPSRSLKDLVCNETGAIQQGYSELELLMSNEYHLNECIYFRCYECITDGFPCHKTCLHGFKNIFLLNIFKYPNFAEEEEEAEEEDDEEYEGQHDWMFESDSD
jgi:hypothetical protein